MERVKRVIATDKANKLIEELISEHGDLIFHLSGGCCDGSQPMCFKDGEFKLGDSDIAIGKICGCYFYTSKRNFEYIKHTQIIVDLTPGRGSSFSLEIPTGYRFIIKSRLYESDGLDKLDLIPFSD